MSDWVGGGVRRVCERGGRGGERESDGLNSPRAPLTTASNTDATNGSNAMQVIIGVSADVRL